jgi:hypothetical protein
MNDNATESAGFEQDGPGEYRPCPSAFSAWRVTRESAKLIAAWCLGSWYDGDTVQVHVPVLGGTLTAAEGYWVIRYGTSSGGAGLFWAVPGDLFESAYASADGGHPYQELAGQAGLLELAWGVIANAGWDGMAQSPGWQEAAVRWRDEYHRVLRRRFGGVPAEDDTPHLPSPRPRTRAEARGAAARALAEYAAFGPGPEPEPGFDDASLGRLAALLRADDRQPPGQIRGSAL